ncbi:MAG: hypothetical protein Q9160_006889 [Pyrenula sp. 1 TL-2023]
MALSLRSSCPSCRTWNQRLLRRRTFATSSSAQAIPPESQHYIDVPPMIQPESPLKKPIKGILPVPREIFPKRNPDKLTSDFIVRATPDKSARRRTKQPLQLSQEEVYNNKMTTLRKSHLSEGLTELRLRKQTMTRQVGDRSREKTDERSRLLAQAEREDDRLTGSTIPVEMLPEHKSYQSQETIDALLAQKVTNTEVHQARRREERQDALHTLYVNSQTFITTEAQLNSTIDRVFPEGKHSTFDTKEKYGTSIWNQGLQPTIEGLVNRQKAGLRSKYSRRIGEGEKQTVNEERLNRIAEELSGGKIPDPDALKEEKR